MTLSKAADVASLFGLALGVILAIIDRREIIEKWGQFPMMFNLILICFIIAVISVCVSLFARRNTGKLKFSKNYKFTEVRNRKFNKETVPVDGYGYEHCSFEDVTFDWNGTAPFKFQYCSFLGRPNINTRSDTVTTTIILLKALQILREDVPLVQGD